MIARQSSVTRRRALVGASSLVALAPLSSLPAIGAIPALFAEWQAAFGPYIAALNEYGVTEEAWFSDKGNPEKTETKERAEAAAGEIEDAVIDLERRITEAPACTLADLRCKLRIRAKFIGLGDGDLEGATDRGEKLVLRLLADVERLAGKAVAS